MTSQGPPKIVQIHMRHPVDPLFQIISQIMSLVAHGFGRVVYFRNRIKELAYFLFQMTLMFA